MSQTWSLVCHETKKKVWIGQGTGSMSRFYSRVPSIMERLRQFLVEHEDKNLVFLCDDNDWDCTDYEEYLDEDLNEALNEVVPVTKLDA